MIYYGKKAGITGVRVSPHTFRHTMAVTFLRNGGDVFILQRILGRSQLEAVRGYVNLAQPDISRVHRRNSPVDNLELKLPRLRRKKARKPEKPENAARYLRDKLLIKLLARLGCRISEALTLEVKDIDFAQGMVAIEHLKSRIKLSCPRCNTTLEKSHTFCPKCGKKVDKAVASEQEHRRLRRLPLDKDTLQMLKDYIKHGEPLNRRGKRLLFGINRHRA